MTDGSRTSGSRRLLDPARVLLEFSTEAAYIAEVDGPLVWLAPSVSNVLGRDPESLLGRRVRDLVIPEDRDRSRRWRDLLMESSVESRAVTAEPLRFAKGNGDVVWCTVTARLVFDDEGRPIGITGAIRDVDDLVRSRDRATHENQHLHEALDAQQDPWVTAVAVRDELGEISDFRFEEVNRAAAQFHELPTDDMAGRTFSEVYGSDAAAPDVRAGAEVVSTGAPIVLNDQWSSVAQARGRPSTWLDIRITAIGPQRLIYTWRDVTERHRAQEARADALSLLQTVMDAQIEPHAILRAVREADGQIVDFVYEDCNSAAAEFEGWPRADIVGRTLREVSPTRAEAELDIADCRSVLLSGEPIIQNEIVTDYVRADGRPIVSDGRIVPIDGERVSYSWRDVTERYLGQESLAEAFGLLRAVMDAQIEPHAILRAVRDSAGLIIDFVYDDCNEAAAEFEGHARDELIGHPLTETTATAHDAAYDIRICAAVLESGEATVQNDVATGYIRADGRPIVVDLRVVPVGSDRVSYTWRDVTDRYEDERRLRESEQRFRLLTEASSDVVYVAGLDGRITWVAPTITKSLGWRTAEWVGHLPGEFFHPDDAVGSSEDLAVEGPGGHDGLHNRPEARRIRTADGAYRWMSVHHAALHDSDGRLLGVSGAMKDVDQLVQARLQILEAHDTLRAVMDNQVDPHEILEAVRDPDGRIVDFTVVDYNEAAERFEGAQGGSLVGRRLTEFYASQKDAEDDISFASQVVTTGAPVMVNDEPTETVDAQGRPIRLDIRIVSIGGDRVSYGWRDVTDRYEGQQRLAESEARFRLLAENMSDVVVLVTNGIIEWISPSVEWVLGWTVDELSGHPSTEIVHPDDLDAVAASWQSVAEGALPRIRFRARERLGTSHWMEASGTVMTTESGRRVVLGARVVDAEVEARTRLEQMARHDELTGLINRHAVFELLDRAMSGDQRQGGEVAVLFCDLDGFKGVNDQYGHSAGDQLLRTVGERVQAAVRGGDVVARIGGDELLVVLQGVGGLDDAIRVAEKVRQAISFPVDVAGGSARVSGSIGVGIARAGQTVDDLVAAVDQAMYEAKRSGKDAVVAVRPN